MYPPLIFVGIIPVIGVKDHYPLIRSKCSVNVVDVYSISELVQEYENKAPVDCDVDYIFPLPPNAAVCAFKAVINGKKTIKGVVREKGEAKKEYQEAVAQGLTAGLLEKEHADVFRVSLGNLKPKEAVSVLISFVSIIEHDGSAPDVLRLTIPTTIAPRYGSPPPALRGPNARSRMELSVAISMNHAVTSIKSPTHPIALTLGCAAPTLIGDFEPSKAYISLSDSVFLEKDVVIIISAQKLDHPRCSVERKIGQDETTDAYALTFVPKFDLPALEKQEYIFLVDRSGSMAGSRMEAVKTALQIMLRSLPSKNTSFNIVSFGSSHSNLWKTSQTYASTSVEAASKHVDTMTANMGGTEMRSALVSAFVSAFPSRKSASAEDIIPATVFVLTDGEAWDLDGVIKEVSDAVKMAKEKKTLLRTFVLGVGNDVSVAMCEGIARAGKGAAVFVANGEKPDAKLMSLLRAARGGVIEDLEVDWGVETTLESKSKAEFDPEGDFDMVSEFGSETATLNSLPPAKPAINLFDIGSEATLTTPDLGPVKAIVNLPPPTRIQQAPKTEKLPIPLYPGFRCSIFAIVKQASPSVPFASVVRLKGTTMGHPVVLELPITSVPAIAQTDNGEGKLLHTLAARALVQYWDDQMATPEVKAQIERLGKKYSLATSQTSFLAIDEESRKELKVGESKILVPLVLERGGGLDTVVTQTHSRSVSGSGFREFDREVSGERLKGSFFGAAARKPALAFSSTPRGASSAMVPKSSHFTAYGAPAPPAPSSAPYYTVSMPRSVPMPQAPSPSAAAPASYDMNDYDPTIESDILGMGQEEYSSSPPTKSMYRLAQLSSLGSPNLPETARRSKAEYGPAPLTLEAIARAQSFSGSFSPTPSFISQLLGKQQLPSAPSSLTALTGSSTDKDTIWITILALAVLNKKFVDDKASWELLDEKAKEYLVDSLVGMGVGKAEVEILIREMRKAGEGLV